MSNPFQEFKQRIIAMIEMGGVSQAALDRTEIEIREEFGGDIYYLAKGSERAPDQSERNRSIIRDWKNGERLPFLARRYRLSKRRIMQIING